MLGWVLGIHTSSPVRGVVIAPNAPQACYMLVVNNGPF